MPWSTRSARSRPRRRVRQPSQRKAESLVHICKASYWNGPPRGPYRLTRVTLRRLLLGRGRHCRRRKGFSSAGQLLVAVERHREAVLLLVLDLLRRFRGEFGD